MVYFGIAMLVAAHDPHDDAGDHEGEDEKDDVEGYAHYVHGKMKDRSWFIDLTEKLKAPVFFFSGTSGPRRPRAWAAGESIGFCKRLIFQNRPSI